MQAFFARICEIFFFFSEGVPPSRMRFFRPREPAFPSAGARLPAHRSPPSRPQEPAFPPFRPQEPAFPPAGARPSARESPPSRPEKNLKKFLLFL